MGRLRARALTERDEAAEKRAAAERERREDVQRRHVEKAQAVADFLTQWTGEPVAPTDIVEAPKFFSGFHSYATWRVTVDGFDLVVKQEKDPAYDREHSYTHEWKFQIHQVTSGDEARIIRKAADLLDPPPSSVGEDLPSSSTNHHREIPGDTGIARGA
jgi:hypothetical protein